MAEEFKFFNLPASKLAKLVMMVLIFAIAFILVPRINASSDLEKVEKSGEFKFVPKGVLSGLITDSQTGKPVTDALLKISPGDTAKTDANGFYYFEKIRQDGNYKVGVVSKEYIGTGITYSDKMKVIYLQKDKQTIRHFKLDKACRIEIRVIDEAGKPIKGAKLFATSLADNRKREIETSKTNDEGVCLLGGFKPSETNYLITATHHGKSELVEENGRKYRQGRWDYATDKLVVKLTDPNVIESGEIVLKKGIKVRGYAEYVDGEPAEDLQISAYPDWWHSNNCPERYSIDPNGYFTISHILPGLYNIEIDIPEGSGSRGFNVSQTKLPLEGDELLIVKVPEKSPQSLVSISGTVTFVGEKKPRYVRIDAYSSQNTRGHTNLGYNYNTKEIESTFVIDRLEPGVKYKLTFEGDNIERKILEDVEAPSEGLEVELMYSVKPRLQGTVVNSQTGKSVLRFKARIRKLRILRGYNYVTGNQWNEFRNAEGRFEIEMVGPGIYQVQVAADGYAWAWSKEINTDENKPVVVELTEGGSIKGRVVDESGKPINSAKVIPLSMAESSKSWEKGIFVSEAGAVETTNGEFLLENLEAGIESLKVLHPDYVYLTVEGIKVVDGKVTDVVDIVLRNGGNVEGYVYDHEGKPEAGEVLYFYESNVSSGGIDTSSGPLSTVTTDANGFYKVAGLPEKICYAQRNDVWQGLGVVSRVVIPENGKTTRLDFGGRPVVRGKLVINGEAVGNRRVLLGGFESSHSDTFRCFAMTDGNGNFEFRGAVAGKCALYYKVIEDRSRWNKAMVIDIGDEDVDLGEVPGQMSQLKVAIVKDDRDSGYNIQRVFLNKGDEPRGNYVGEFKKPIDPSQPYVLDDILPGVYTLVIVREDNTAICERIEVDKGVHKVIVQIPKSTASISGKFTGHPLTIWRKDKKVICTIQQNTEGTYKVENLPAGRYFADGNMLIEKPLLADFELSEDEHKTIDFDTFAWQEELKLKSTSGILFVNVALDNGVPVAGVEVWLERGGEVVKPLGSMTVLTYFMAEAGDYILHVTYPGYKHSSVEATLEKYDPQSDARHRRPLIVRLERE